jgi:hypothetical protein
VYSSTPKHPPEAESIRDLTRIAGILALIIGVILVFIGAVFIIVLVGVIPLIIGIVNILIYLNCKEITRLIDNGEYNRAKEKTLVWMVIGFIFGGVIIGVILLVAYLKYSELLKRSQPFAPI